MLVHAFSVGVSCHLCNPKRSFYSSSSFWRGRRQCHQNGCLVQILHQTYFVYKFLCSSESSVKDYMQVVTKFIFPCSPRVLKWPYLSMVNDTVQMALYHQAM